MAEYCVFAIGRENTSNDDDLLLLLPLLLLLLLRWRLLLLFLEASWVSRQHKKNCCGGVAKEGVLAAAALLPLLIVVTMGRCDPDSAHLCIWSNARASQCSVNSTPPPVVTKMYFSLRYELVQMAAAVAAAAAAAAPPRWCRRTFRSIYDRSYPVRCVSVEISVRSCSRTAKFGKPTKMR